MSKTISARNAEILDRYERGEKLRDIGASFGLTHERVRQIATRAGLPPRLQEIRERNQKIIEYGKTAMTPEEIVAAFGIDRKALYPIFYAAGLPIPGGLRCPRHTFSPNPQTGIQIMSDIRETAIANYGKAPASKIAEAAGTTRNSIIGHWFRARRQGLIA